MVGVAMGYIDKNLLEGEKVIYKTRLHKIIFIWPLVWVLFAITFVALGKYVRQDFYFFAGLFGAVALIHAFVIWVYYITCEFGITSHRLVVKEGFIKRKTVEVLLNRVESIQVEQGITGRILNYGTVTICGTGGATDPFEKIRAPLEFKGKVHQQLAER